MREIPTYPEHSGPILGNVMHLPEILNWYYLSKEKSSIFRINNGAGLNYYAGFLVEVFSGNFLGNVTLYRIFCICQWIVKSSFIPCVYTA
jgi:hypothetical protein